MNIDHIIRQANNSVASYRVGHTGIWAPICFDCSKTLRQRGRLMCLYCPDCDAGLCKCGREVKWINTRTKARYEECLYCLWEDFQLTRKDFLVFIVNIID